MVHLKFEQALNFANSRHSGQTRKGSGIPYITHPIQVASYLAMMSRDNNLLIAGLLHDTVEDTNTDLEEIEALFGSEVAYLVKSHTEDKSKSWDERKAQEIKIAKEGCPAERMLILADKLANIKSLKIELMLKGEELWKNFNAPPKKQSKYYGDLTDALKDLEKYDFTAPLYYEFLAAYKDIFVTYYINEEKNTIYQLCVHGEGYLLTKDHPKKWIPTENVPELAERITRQLAERLEDTWCDIAYAKGILDTVK